MTRVSWEVKDRILITCGDSQWVTGQSKKVDPCLQCFPGVHTMCNDNSKLRTNGIGQWNTFEVKHINLKDDAPPLYWKNWDNYNVSTVNA